MADHRSADAAEPADAGLFGDIGAIGGWGRAKPLHRTLRGDAGPALRESP